MQNMQSSLKDGCTYAQLRDNQRNTKNTNKYKVQLHPHAERRICNQVLIVGDNLITDPAVLNRCSFYISGGIPAVKNVLMFIDEVLRFRV